MTPDERPLWPEDLPGVLVLPSGRRVRGRSVARGVPEGLGPTSGLYLLGRRPPATPWPAQWVRWPDFGLPARPLRTVGTVARALATTDEQRLEVACTGGTGRTGTVLAAMAVLDGLDPDDALRWVRERYRPRAVETPWQRQYLRLFVPARRRTAGGRPAP
jgi:hypothetical protein